MCPIHMPGQVPFVFIGSRTNLTAVPPDSLKTQHQDIKSDGVAKVIIMVEPLSRHLSLNSEACIQNAFMYFAFVYVTRQKGQLSVCGRLPFKQR